MAVDAIIIPDKAKSSIVAYINSVLRAKRGFDQFNTKLRAIDIGYSCYVAQKAGDIPEELDIDNLAKHDRVNIPLIVSQVDSLKAYFADVYLSGMPLFPVASSAVASPVAEAFESLIDAQAVKGRYARQLMLAFTDAAKYDFCAIEAHWDSLPPFLPAMDDTQGKRDATQDYRLTKLRRYDPYNTLWDYRVQPADHAYDAEYAGDIQLITRNVLKRKLNELSERNASMNAKDALSNARLNFTNDKGLFYTMNGKQLDVTSYPTTYTMKPQISQFITSEAFRNGGTWEDYIATGQFGSSVSSAYPNLSNMYELVTLYARIIPAEHGIKAPRRNSPQLWKFELINGRILISAERIATPHEILPVLVAQPHEDGFSYQTLSAAESQIPLQRATSDLYNVRIASSKRALNDRMIYDPEMVDVMDVNSTNPAAKIPIKSLRLGRGLKDAVQVLPFDGNATSGILGDMQQTIQLSYMLTGLNPFRQGQTQKGNRTMAEFDSIINFSDLRTRVLALMLEYQLFQPLKEILKFNILRNLDEVEITNPTTGQAYKVKKEDLLQAALEFRVADGFTPKSKLLATDDLQQALMFMQNNDQLRGEYDLGGMFAHLMSLRGVKNIAQYKYSQEDKKAIVAKAMPIIQEMQAQQERAALQADAQKQQQQQQQQQQQKPQGGQ